MPGVTARSATKNMSKNKRAAADKNTRRVEAAVNGDIGFCTYGKITKALGNKMFMVTDTKCGEHLSHIRGKIPRVTIDDVVLLNIRDYESRSGSCGAVYDIMAVLEGKDVSKLVRTESIPHWMASKGAQGDSDELRELFDYDDGEEEEIDVDAI